MKTPLIVLTVALAGIGWAQSNATRQAPVYDTISANEVKTIISSLGSNLEIGKSEDGDPRITFTANGADVTLDFYDCTRSATCESMNIWVGWSVDEPLDLEDINTWNYEARYGKAFSDDEAVYLDLDLDLNGGVTADKIKAFVELFLSQVEDFADEYQLN
jgi:hypothetical protein